MKIREFNVGDVFTVVDLLSSIAGSAGNDLRNILRSGNGDNKEVTESEAEDRGVEICLYVLNKSYLGCKEKLMSWFSSLVDMTIEDFLRQPPETILDIIEELTTGKTSRDFFSSVSKRLQKKGFSETTIN